MAKILVVGSSNTDMVVRTDRFPVPGETILGGAFFMFAGGKGANQAVAASRLGGEVTLIAKVGNDVFGKEAKSGLRKEKIDTSFITTDRSHPSGVALILVNDEGENEIVVASGANHHLTPADIQKAHSAVVQADMILVQLECPLDTVIYIIDLAKKENKALILNPAPARVLDDKILSSLFLITPNETEAEILTGISVSTLRQADQAAKVLLDKGVQHVIITMGASGSFYKSRDDMFFIKASKVEAVDSTGAGDVFNGGLAVAIAEGKNWRDAIQFATKAAGISVTRMGAQASAPYLGEMSQINIGSNS